MSIACYHECFQSYVSTVLPLYIACYMTELMISLVLLHQCNGSSAVQEISDSFQSAEWLAILGGGCTVDTQTALSLLQEDGISMVRVARSCCDEVIHL